MEYFESLLKRLRERKKVYQDRILSGTFQVMDEYKLIIGKLRGIEESIEHAVKLYKDLFDIKVLKQELENEDSEN